MKFPLARLRAFTLLAAVAMLAAAALLPELAANALMQLHAATDGIVLRHALQPDAAAMIIAGGWLLLCVEFCRPGTYLAGAAGMLSLTLGGYAVALRIDAHAGLPLQWATICVLAVAALLTALFVGVAVAARRAKHGMRWTGEDSVSENILADSSAAKPTE